MNVEHGRSRRLRLTCLRPRLCIVRLASDQPIPAWATTGPFFSVTRTEQELSIVCLEDRVPDDTTREDGWRALCVEGPLDFSWVGIVAALSRVLAEAGVSIFVVSTYDTDYVLVRETDVDRASDALTAAGHLVG